MKPRKAKRPNLQKILNLKSFFPRKIKNRRWNHSFLVSMDEEYRIDKRIRDTQFGSK